MAQVQRSTQSQQQAADLMPEKIIPLKLVVKFEPPVIGLMYKRNENDKKKHIYNILLNGIINNPDTEQVTQQIFDEHSVFLNRKIVSFEQIQGLVLRIQEYFVNLANLDEEQIAAMQQQGQYGPDGQLYYDDNEEMDEEAYREYQKQMMMQQQQQDQQDQEEEGSGGKFNKKNSF